LEDVHKYQEPNDVQHPPDNDNNVACAGLSQVELAAATAFLENAHHLIHLDDESSTYSSDPNNNNNNQCFGAM